jgi:gas vesicle protein
MSVGDPGAPGPGDPGGYDPREGELSAGIKFLIGALLAVIAGLIVGLLLLGGSGDDAKDKTVPTITRTVTETATQVQTRQQTVTQSETQVQTQTQTVTQTVTVPPPGP